MRSGGTSEAGAAGDGAKQGRRAERLAAVAAGLGAALFLIAFVVSFVARERFIYFWDYAGYWPRLLELEARFAVEPAAALRAIAESIRTEDYNLLAASLLAPLDFALGPSRLAYVGSVLALYGMAAVVAFAVWLRIALADGSNRPAVVAPAAIATIALVPQVWLPVVAGYLDVAGCALAIALLCLLGRAALPHSLPRAALLGIGLAGLVLVRRWYAYWAVALFPAMVAVALGEACAPGVERGRRCAASLGRIAASGAVAGAALLALAQPIAVRMATADFARQYAAYRATDSLRAALRDAIGHFGWLLTALAGAGLVLAVADRRTARLALLLVVQAAVAFALFNRTQSMGWQHEYLLLPAVLFFVAVGLVRGLEALRSPGARWLLAAGFCAVLAAGFAALFSAAAEPLAERIAPLFSRVRYRPLERGDLAEVARLVRAVAAGVPAAGPPTVYVLASSTVLNDEVLGYAHLADPTLPDLRGRLLRTAHVDARDGFPSNLLGAELVVLGEPTQLHLGAAFQRGIALPAEQIRSGAGIGRSFAALPGEFQLDGGVRVRLYRRSAPVAREDEDSLRTALAAQAPDATPPR